MLIARHLPDGELAAVMVRAERRVFIDGSPASLAYIGQIRIAPRYQGRWLMQRATLEVAGLHDRSLPYLGVIASDNAVALGTIAGRRPPGEARVRRVARLRSLAFILHDRARRPRATMPLTGGDAVHLDELVTFLLTMGPRRQFFPVVSRDDLTDGRAYRGLRLEDLCVVRRDGEIAGVLGSWDQSRLQAGDGGRLRSPATTPAPRLRPARPDARWRPPAA